jgi:hypothetical protein
MSKYVPHSADLCRSPLRRPRTSYFKEKQMGRPVNKRNFGVATGAELGIRVSARPTGAAAAGYILNQRGTKKFTVTTVNGTGVCTLVDKAENAIAAGEMSLVGIVGGNTEVRIAKLYNRTVRDFSNNRYKWTLVNDSSADYIELTAI